MLTWTSYIKFLINDESFLLLYALVLIIYIASSLRIIISVRLLGFGDESC